MTSTLRSIEHELLKPSQGIWDLTYEKYLEANTEPVISRGVANSRLLVGGLWLVMDQRYDFPGGAWEGRAAYGYDPKLGRFTAWWVDSSNPHVSSSDGDFDNERREWILNSHGVNATTGERADVRHSKIEVDDNTHVFASYLPDANGERKLLQVTATRRRQGFRPIYDRRYAEASLPGWEGVGSTSGWDHDFPNSSPVREHELLQLEAGIWESEVRLGPDGDRVRNVTETTSLITGGLWAISDIKAESGEPFEARRVLGFDPDDGAYAGVYVDSQSPHRVIFKGEFSAAENELRLVAESIDPESGEQTTEQEITRYGKDERERILVASREGQDLVVRRILSRRVA
jgi:Protein of unknown function (DUF1579)